MHVTCNNMGKHSTDKFKYRIHTSNCKRMQSKILGTQVGQSRAKYAHKYIYICIIMRNDKLQQDVRAKSNCYTETVKEETKKARIYK